MLNKKAQSAMEYLMTYGWAILVVLIALGALFYLGVFSPRTPNSCVATAPIVCTDVKATQTSNVITFTVGASGVTTAGFNMITTNGITNNTGTCSAAPFTCAIQENALDNPTISTTATTAKTLTYKTAVLTLTKDAKFSGTANVQYLLTGSTTPHITTVQFSGTVEA